MYVCVCQEVKVECSRRKGMMVCVVREGVGGSGGSGREGIICVFCCKSIGWDWQKLAYFSGPKEHLVCWLMH